MSGILTTPTIEVKVNSVAVAIENILECQIHLGCTKEVSTCSIVVDNSNPDYNSGDYSPSGAKEFTKGHSVTIKIKRGTITSATNYLFTGTLETLEYIDEAEEYQYRNVVVLSGRCNGQQLFNRKFDGDLIATVSADAYREYKRTDGEAESLVAYLIDTYTSLSHIRVTSVATANAAAAQKVVNVTDGTKFTVGDLVKIYDDVTWEYNKVASKATHALTMTNVLINSYTTAANLTVGVDLIRDTDTTYTKMEFSHETVFDIIKWIADTADTSGTIGYDSRVEYDGKYAFLPRGLVTESYSLAAQVQLERYLDDSTRIKNKITVYGKADKPYPIDVDGQEYSDDLTEAYTCNVADLASDANSGQNEVEVETGKGSQFSVGDYCWIADKGGTLKEQCQVASIDTDTLTMEDNLANTYTIANASILFVLDTSAKEGWGYIPNSSWNDMTIYLSTFVYEEGSYSLGCTKTGSNIARLLFVFEEGQEIDMDLYNELRGLIYFHGVAPISVRINLWSGDANSLNHIAYGPTLTGFTASEWSSWSVAGGTKNANNWRLGSLFDWTDVKYLMFLVIYPAVGTHVFYLDRLHWFGNRWGGHGSDVVVAGVDGFAEDAGSQSTYGIREHVVTNDLLLSDAECEVKAQGLLSFYTNARITIIPDSKSVDWVNYPIIPGNKVAVNLTPLGISGNYRIDAVDIRLSGIDHELTATFEMDDTPPRTADYLQGIVDRLKIVEKSVENISVSSSSRAISSGSGGSTSTTVIAIVEAEATLDLTGDVTIAVGKSLSVDTISEKGSGTGVTIDGLLIKDGGVGETLVVTGNITPEASDTRNLGSTSLEFANLYIGDNGKIYLGVGQDVSLARGAANTLVIVASALAISISDTSKFFNVTCTPTGGTPVDCATLTCTEDLSHSSGYARGLYVNYTHQTNAVTGSGEINGLACDINATANVPKVMGVSIYTGAMGSSTIDQIYGYYLYMDNNASATVNQKIGISLEMDNTNAVTDAHFIKVYSHAGKVDSVIWLAGRAADNAVEYLLDLESTHEPWVDSTKSIKIRVDGTDYYISTTATP